MEKVTYNKKDSKLIISIKDVSIKTAFRNDVIADILTEIYSALEFDYDKKNKFKYFKDKDYWGFKTIKKNNKQTIEKDKNYD